MAMGKGLISRLNQGDHSAWEEIHDEYGPNLFGLAKAVTGNADDAKDVVQETILKAYMRIYDKPYESVEEVVKYIYWKTRCNSLDRHRRRTSRKTHEGQYAGMEAAHYLPGELEEEDPWFATLIRAAERELAALPKQQQKILQMIYKEDLGRDEVAKMLGLSEVTVRNHHARGLVTLRKKLGIRSAGKWEKFRGRGWFRS